MNTNLTTAGQNDVIPGTGWTFADASSMAKEVARDNRLFGKGRTSRPRRTVRPEVGLMVSDPARFTAETGWSPEDAMSMALEQRSDRIHFGTRH
jgi:hypothetical protein